MKKTDIAMIILIASLSVIVAYFATNAILGEANAETQSVPVAEPITAEIAEPNPAVFNEDAINPAVEVQVGNSN